MKLTHKWDDYREWYELQRSEVDIIYFDQKDLLELYYLIGDELTLSSKYDD